MCRGMKVCSDGKREAYERHERSHGVHDQYRGQRMTCRGWERKLRVGSVETKVVYNMSAPESR